MAKLAEILQFDIGSFDKVVADDNYELAPVTRTP